MGAVGHLEGDAVTLDELRAQLAKLDHLPGDTIVVLAKCPKGTATRH